MYSWGQRWPRGHQRDSTIREPSTNRVRNATRIGPAAQQALMFIDEELHHGLGLHVVARRAVGHEEVAVLEDQPRG